MGAPIVNTSIINELHALHYKASILNDAFEYGFDNIDNVTNLLVNINSDIHPSDGKLTTRQLIKFVDNYIIPDLLKDIKEFASRYAEEIDQHHIDDSQFNTGCRFDEGIEAVAQDISSYIKNEQIRDVNSFETKSAIETLYLMLKTYILELGGTIS